MTIGEFDATGWHCGMKAEYRGKVYDIGSTDFEERLVGLCGVVQGSDDLTWVRCENISII